MSATRVSNLLPSDLLRRLSDSDQEEFQVSLEEVNKDLRMLGIDPGPLLAKVHEQVSHWDANVKVAQKLDLEPTSMRSRVTILALLTTFGLGGVIATSVALWLELVVAPNERFFVAELLIGFGGLLILGLSALAAVLWTAYVHQSLLARAACAEVSEFEQALRSFRFANPSLENLIRVHFGRSTRMRYHLESGTNEEPCPA